MLKKTYFALALLCYTLVGNAQEITVMSYNTLNFPEGNLIGREDTLKSIIDHVQPDLLLIQELKSDSGLQLIVNHSFSGLPSNYAASTFVAQQSNPGSNHPLQQAIVYNSDLLGIAEEGKLMTPVRDINRFKLFWKPSLPSSDTLFFYVFVTHLKSSQGSSNVAARLEMVQTLTTHFQHLPANAPVIFAGDLNLYTSEEPAYQQLLNADNAIVLQDPLDAPGNWHSASFQPKNILTQCTRSSAIFGDGASGGMDDRFDFVLLSSNMFNPSNTVVYSPDSYVAYGNSGNCYDQSITDCTGGSVSAAMRRSLYYMSDHLPIVLHLNFRPEALAVQEQTTERARVIQNLNGDVTVNWPVNEQAWITVFDMTGRIVEQQFSGMVKGTNRMTAPFAQLDAGYYILQVRGDRTQTSQKFFIGK